MARLDYSLSARGDPRELAGIADARESALRYDHFLGDVTFVVGDLDLSATWGWVPVLDFALGLEFVVGELIEGNTTEELFEFTESEASIRFCATDGQVEITASYAQGTATAELLVLHREVGQFLGRVLDDLVGRHPALAANPFVAPRLRRRGQA